MGQKQKTRKAGRPSLFCKKVVKEICTRLSNGESLIRICQDDHIPNRRVIQRWNLSNKKGFSRVYARARQEGLDWMADNLLEIADDGRNDFMTTYDKNGEPIVKVDHENINRSRLRVDARKWYLSKLAPKRYGDKVTLASDEENPAIPGKVQIEFVKPDGNNEE